MDIENTFGFHWDTHNAMSYEKELDRCFSTMLDNIIDRQGQDKYGAG